MKSFELRRRTASTVYRFHWAARSDRVAGHRREDLDVWIVRSPTLGWITIEDATGTVTGRPWNVPPEQQSDQPLAAVTTQHRDTSARGQSRPSNRRP